MKYSHTIIAAAVLLFLLAGCGRNDPPAFGPFASTLEGEALARYEGMTPRQRQGVETLAERLGAERATGWLLASSEERLRIFPPEPYSDRTAFGATLEGEILALYERLDEQGRADIEFYAAALGHEAAVRSLLVLGERERERMEWEQKVSPPADSGDAESSVQPPEEGVTAPDRVSNFYTPGNFRASLPALEDALSPDEKAKLDALDPRIRKPFVGDWQYSAPMIITAPDPGDPNAWLAFIDPKAFVADGVERITEEQKRVLMAVPAELPPIEDLVFPELVADFEGLPPRLKEMFWSDAGTTFAQGMTVGRWGLPPLTDEEIRKMFSRRIEQYQRASPIYENRG